MTASKRYRRNSAGGMALHHWQQKQGKHTTIHVVYELERPIAVADLTAAVDEKLLKRFPRFRGFVTSDEWHWEVPDQVDPADYVETIELSAPSQDAEPTALKKHVQNAMTVPLPSQRSWNVQLVTFPGGSPDRCYIVWRISHTVADGVVLAQIMSKVLCDTIDDESTGADGDGAKQLARAPAFTDTSPPAPTRHQTRAGIFERIWAFLCGVFFVVALPFWPSDKHTQLQLGPYRWRDRVRKKGKGTSETLPATSSTGDGPIHAAGAEGVALCVGEPVDVAAIKQAAAATGATVNDLLMAALAAGMRQYLESKGKLPPRSDALKLTAVAVINPRSAMPQDLGSGSHQLLDDYESMRGAGCDITLAILPLPCGNMSPPSRLAAVKALTRKVKLSPSPLLLRFFAKVLCKLLGLRSLIALYTIVLAKFTTYVSNVVAPPLTGAFCGARINDIWFGTTPLDFGVSFSFLSYAGRNRLCCVADALTVPDPEVISAMVHASLVEQIQQASASQPSMPVTVEMTT